MARPEKQGLDYFPLDIDIDSDDKVYLVQAKHGIAGFGILIKLYMKIYRNGYYLRFTEREEIIFAAQNNIDINVCRNVINECINESIFDKNIYNEYEILTSKGIQKRYFEISERRKKTELIKEIRLIDTTKYDKLVIVSINEVNDNINTAKIENRGVNDDIYPESKVKESKVNKTESKQKTTTFAASDKKFQQNSGNPVAPKNAESPKCESQGIQLMTFDENQLTTFAVSDKKTYRLPPKESDVSTGLPNKKGDILTEQSPVQPEVATGLPVETTQIALAEPPAQITPGKLLELPVQTRGEFTEPSLGQKNVEIEGAVKPLPENEKIGFDYETGKFTSVTDAHIGRWKEAYPAVEVLTELRQMAVWADTNRKNRKSHWQRFIINWLKRSQDKAPPVAPSWKGGRFGQFGNSKPTYVGETEKPKGKYDDQVDEVIYTDA